LDSLVFCLKIIIIIGLQKGDAMLRVYIVFIMVLIFSGCHRIGTFEDMKSVAKGVHEARREYNEEKKKKNLEGKKKTLSTQKAMATWKGHHISELIKIKGPADKTSPDGLGGTIYSFIKSYKSQTYTEEHDPRNRRARTPIQDEVEKVTRTYGGQTTEVHQMFYANQDGIIYHTLLK